MRSLFTPGTFERVVSAVARRPLPVLAAVALLAVAGAVLTLRLDPSAGTDTLVDEDSPASRATEEYRQQFGDDAVIVLIKGELTRTMLVPANLQKLIALEGCLSGNVPPEGLSGLPPVCSQLAEARPAKVVYGPGTFVNTAVSQINDGLQAQIQVADQEAERAGEAARKASKERGDSPAQQKRLEEQAQQLAQSQFAQEALGLALRYGITSIPSIDSPQFISQLVFDSRRGPGEPKTRFAYLFPSSQAALVQVRLRPDLGEEERERAVDMIRTAAGDERFRQEGGAQYIVTGVPVVVDALASELQGGMLVLLLAALALMAATLLLVFRTALKLRMLPLALALGAAALAFGAVSLAGGSLTMASIAALPVLIGLAVDYAIQFQARFDEARWNVASPPRDATLAGPAAARVGGPTIATAGVATIVGFLVLLLSPVPMVRGFGILLVIGIVLAFACVLTAGFAVLTRFSGVRERPEDVPPALPRTRAVLGRVRARLHAGLARVGRLRVFNPLRSAAWAVADAGRAAGRSLARTGQRAVWTAVDRPRRVLAIGLALAVVGWGADTQTEVISDVRELVPRDLQALQDVNELQEATGVSGQIDVTVRADDLTDPAVITWMTEFQDQALRAHGYRTGATCAQKADPPELCPAFSLPDLFSRGEVTQQSVRALLEAVPPYFSQAVISDDRKTATMAFGIRLMPLERQQEVVEDIQSRLDPPEGVTAQVTGLPVLAAEANSALSSTWRRALTLLAALAGVFLVLLVIRRSRREAAIPLIPIALATGWSALVLFMLQIPLNPMSATLGALVIAISTEFSVLLSARYRQERDAGATPEEALDVTYASTGGAVLASGATAIAGFAALIASDIRMLRDFGAVTVVDLTVSLLGVMVVLPAALVWAEEREVLLRVRDLDPRRWLRRPRLRRPRLPRMRMPRPRMPRLPRPRLGLRR
ncbi:MAG: MMPL family transporter [Thermoleophilaceae bacterium]